MQLKDTAEEAAWRAEVREFLAKSLPPEVKTPAMDTTRVRGAEGFTVTKHSESEAKAGGAGVVLEGGPMGQWRQSLADKGWIAPAWPKEYGGAGLTKAQQYILNEEFAKVGAPLLGGMGVTMIGPTLITHGTDEQKAEHLPKIIRGETNWCQGFSEPGSGSDLASLQTKAVRDGDDYIINGSKIWTSRAQYANWMFMLARTDPDAPKHRGITYFMLDFTSPGITVQPLITMGGTAHFNQIFFDNVRVPAKNVVGEVNRGWYVGTTTLDYERSGIGSSTRVLQAVDDLVEWRRQSGNARGSGAIRNEIADRYIEAKVAKMLAYRVVHMQNVGQIPNHEASMAKMFVSELTQRTYRTAMKAAGLHGLVWDRESEYAPADAEFAHNYVESVSNTIAGGTSEIQRGIIAQRGLGMPRG